VQRDSGRGSPAEFVLVVDSGFSHTTVTPLISGRPVHSAIRRLNVGGKHLTNHLADLLAIHEINLKEDPWIANEVKEACCFVTDNFQRDMERTWREHNMDPTVVIDVQLPDYQEFPIPIVKPYKPRDAFNKNKAGLATLGNERFQAPEILFNPSDIGMAAVGLPRLILKSIGLLPEGLHASMLSNILVVGGNVLIPGFIQRL
jgi:actin-related protein 6